MPRHLNFPDLIDNGTAPFCNVVMDDNYAFLAGLVAADFAEGRRVLGDVAAETTAVLNAINLILGKIDLDLGAIVRCDVYLADLAEMPAMNEAYAACFPDGNYPARTTTQAVALVEGSRVEITCVARRRPA